MRARLACLTLCLLLLAPAASAAGEADPPASRGEVLLLLWRSAGAVPYDKTAHPFSDLAGRDELGQAAGWAFGLGLVKGVGDGLFAPDRPMTREEFALLLRRNDERLGREVFLPDGAADCNDRADISPWADDSLYWACVMGRMEWRGGRLAPLEPVTRAEAEALFPPLFGSELEYPHSSDDGFSSSPQVLPDVSMSSQVSNFSSISAQVTYQ